MRGMVNIGVGSERVKYYWLPLKLPGRETAGCQPWVCILFFQSRGGSAVPPPLPLPPLSPNCSPWRKPWSMRHRLKTRPLGVTAVVVAATRVRLWVSGACGPTRHPQSIVFFF